MLNVSVASPDALSGATSLLAALADPVSAQKKIDELKAATEQYVQARDQALQAQRDQAEERAELDAISASVRNSKIASDNLSNDLKARQSDLDARDKSLQERLVILETTARDRDIAASQKEQDLTAREAAVSVLEQTLKDREAVIAAGEQALADRVAKLQAAMA